MPDLTQVASLLLFGATGDLARRMLLPSLYGLHEDGLLPPGLTILGTARSPLDDGAFRALASDALAAAIPAPRLAPSVRDGFLGRLSYLPLDATTPEGFDTLGSRLAPDCLGAAAPGLAIFLSTAPSLFRPTIRGLASAGLTGPRVRLALEKPLGQDLASSQQINAAVAEIFRETQIFRIDHYLGKETVQNLIALRFGNALFEPLWRAGGVDHVQITVAETIGLEGRGEYYDGMGALRDMVQNHMLQLVSLIAMEPPSAYTAAAVRDEKVKVLRSLRRPSAAEVPEISVLGQYGPGAVGGTLVPGYAAELGRESETETFVALKAFVDNWRWKGVPFYLRTGKRLPNRQTEILVQFCSVPHSIFAARGAVLHPNRLIIRLQPEETIRLTAMSKEPGLDRAGIRLRELPLDLSLTAAFAGTRRRIAYERLLLDLIDGDPTLFVRADEVEAQWEWVDAIREGWAASGLRPRPYAAGTWGPSAAIGLAERDRVSWLD